MDRINDPSAPNKLFIDADPVAGIEGTIVRGLFLNGVQEELVAGLIERAGLTADPADNTQIFKALSILFAGRLLGVRVFGQSGTYAPSAGVRFVVVEVQAGGGGGGATAPTNAAPYAGAAGGSGGAYGMSLFAVTAFGATVLITVGAYGQPGTGGSDGGNGGASSFGALLSCPGGAGGKGSSGTGNTNYALGGIGPFGGGPVYGANILQMPGQEASDGFTVGGAGLCKSGAGGNARLGMGGGDAGTDQAGHAGSGYGGGGSGAASTTASGGLSGGAGAPGLVIVWEYG